MTGRSGRRPFEVVGTGMLARAFVTSGPGLRGIVCAAGVADSQCTDPAAFRRERELLEDLGRRAMAADVPLVYFSGAPVYGPSQEPHHEADPLAPRTAYGRHKLECEQQIAASGVRYLVLRLPNVVGPAGNPNQLVPSLVRQIATGRVVVRSGATRDLLDVDDVVRIVEALVRTGVTDTILNVASGVSTPVGQLAARVAAILGVSPDVSIVDGGDAQAFSTAAVRAALPSYPTFDAGYAAHVLDRHVPSIYRAVCGAAVAAGTRAGARGAPVA